MSPSHGNAATFFFFLILLRPGEEGSAYYRQDDNLWICIKLLGRAVLLIEALRHKTGDSGFDSR
jgi:hypothetical protein